MYTCGIKKKLRTKVLVKNVSCGQHPSFVYTMLTKGWAIKLKREKIGTEIKTYLLYPFQDSVGPMSSDVTMDSAYRPTYGVTAAPTVQGTRMNPTAVRS